MEELGKKYNSVVFCGYAASGKTTIAKKIAEIFDLEYACAGDILKKMMKSKFDKETNVDSQDFWETEAGFSFFKKRETDDSFDIELDKEMLELVKTKKVSLTSWTLPYLNCEAIKIFLNVPEDERTKRLAGRDSISEKEAKRIISIRDAKNKKHYQKLYNFELGNKKPFDLVLEEKNKTPEEEVNIIKEFLIKKGFVAI